jgi:hypothetical protein
MDMPEGIQPTSSEAAENQVGAVPRGTSLDLPPAFVNMSPVEPAFEQIIMAYAAQDGASH